MSRLQSKKEHKKTKRTNLNALIIKPTYINTYKMNGKSNYQPQSAADFKQKLKERREQINNQSKAPIKTKFLVANFTQALKEFSSLSIFKKLNK